MTLKKVEEYIRNIKLGNYDLDGVEITEDDFVTILNRINQSNKNMEQVVHEYLLEIREVLDIGLDN